MKFSSLCCFLALHLSCGVSTPTRKLQASTSPSPTVAVITAAVNIFVTRSPKCRCEVYNDYDSDNSGILGYSEAIKMVKAAAVDVYGPGVLTDWTKQEWNDLTLPYVGAIPKCAKADKDPHFMTFDGTDFEYQGKCDLLLLNNPSFENGLGLMIHGRTEHIERGINNIRAGFSSIAVGLGEDKFEVNVDGTYYLNGNGDAQLPISVGGQAGYTIATDSEDDCFPGNTRCAASTNFDITSDINGNPMTKQIITVKVNRGMVHIYLQMSEDNALGSVGLMGTYPAVNGQTMVGRDGATLFPDADLFGLEWQVLPEDGGLFQETRAPQFPEQCTPPPAKLESEVKERRLLRSGTEEEMKEELYPLN